MSETPKEPCYSCINCDFDTTFQDNIREIVETKLWPEKIICADVEYEYVHVKSMQGCAGYAELSPGDH